MDSPLGIIGYGAQARAWQQNLQDSRFPLMVYLRRSSPHFSSLQDKGVEVLPLEGTLDACGRFALLTPDHTHLSILQTCSFPQESLIILAHGQSFTKESLGEKFPHLNFALLAPKGISEEVRRQYLEKGPLGAVFSLEGVRGNRPGAENYIMNLAQKLGITLGPYPTTFAEETRCDLFSEQALLCSALPYMALYSYNKLREKGHTKEVAYFECWEEVRSIVDTMVTKGPQKFFELISPMALMGSERGRQKLFCEKYFAKLENIYQDIVSGDFFEEIEQTDFEKTKTDVISFWKKQELTQTHGELKEKWLTRKNTPLPP